MRDRWSVWRALCVCMLCATGVNAQQDPPAEQCCPDIFLAGYHIGAAAGMCHWQISNAALTTHLNESTRLIRQAHLDCSAVNPAWTNWGQYCRQLEQSAARLATADGDTLRAAASGLYGMRDSLANDLSVQIVANQTVRMDTCENHYFGLGFQLGFAQIALAVAADGRITQEVRTSAIQTAGSAIYSARFHINSLAEVRPVTGQCVNLESLKQDLAGVQLQPALDEAAQIGNLVQRVVSNAAQQLQGCGRGTGAIAPSPQALAGIWQVRVSRLDPNGNWIISADDEVLELTDSPGRFGMLIGRGKLEFTREWLIRGNEIHLVDDQGRTTVRYRFVNAQLLLMLELRSGPTHFVDREDDGVRIELQR